MMFSAASCASVTASIVLSGGVMGRLPADNMEMTASRVFL